MTSGLLVNDSSNDLNTRYNDIIVAYKLAQEYIKSAELQNDDWNQASLISMAVACLEAILSAFSARSSSLSRTETSLEIITLYRLAQILLKYTQNHTYAEKLLSKAITLASRFDHVTLRLEAELLMISLFLRTGHRALASKLVDKSLKESMEFKDDVGLNRLTLSFFLLKTIIDPKNASQALHSFAWNYAPAHNVRLVNHIIEAQWYMRNQCDYEQAAIVMKILEPASTTPREVHVSWLLTTILCTIACGKFQESKCYVSQLHSMLDKVDWTTWRDSVPLNTDSDTCNPLFIRCLTKDQAISCTHLLSGIFYLSQGKISLSIRFLQQGSTVSDKDNVFLFSFYLTFAYFMSFQWHKGYQTMTSILAKLPKELAEYLCGIYFQMTGDLNKAKDHYRGVIENSSNENDELIQFSELNIDIIEGKQLEFDDKSTKNPQLQAFGQIFSSDEFSLENELITNIDSTNSQLRIILLYLIAKNQHGSSTAKSAYNESAKTKNWLWTWMSGCLLHQSLIEEDKLLVAQSQLTANQQLETNLIKMYNGGREMVGVS